MNLYTSANQVFPQQLWFDAMDLRPTYVTGTISEVPLPCTHQQMVSPEWLGEVWSAIARWMGMESG